MERKLMFADITAGTLGRLRNNRLTSTIYHEARLRLESLKGQRPLLIYQMGKVGSTSILASLKAAKLKRPIFHVHFLHPPHIDNAERTLRSKLGRHGSVNRWAIYESRFVVSHIIQNSPSALTVVSLVRDPVARNISSFFANLDLFIPDCASRYDAGQIGVGEITDAFLTAFHEHDLSLSWFDVEMRQVFGADVYASRTPALRNHGAFVYKNETVDLIVLRMEDINRSAQQALKDFLKLDNLALISANEAGVKDYSRVYRDFREQLSLPSEYLTKMYNSKLARYFYSDQELERFRASWSNSRA